MEVTRITGYVSSFPSGTGLECPSRGVMVDDGAEWNSMRRFGNVWTPM